MDEFLIKIKISKMASRHSGVQIIKGSRLSISSKLKQTRLMKQNYHTTEIKTQKSQKENLKY